MPENNLFEIKKRITAARQTRKITSTMELTASSRLQRGKAQLAACHAWLDELRGAVHCLPDECFASPALDEGRKNAYLVFGGNKGLSGAYSPNLLHYAAPIVEGNIVLCVGSAAQLFFPDAHRSFGEEPPSMERAAEMARTAKALCARGEASEVYLIYTRGSKPLTERLYPPTRPGEYDEMVLIEPSAGVLFPALLDEYAAATVLETHLHAFLAEQIARVAAMDSASRNADEIIDGLQARYNQIRQGSITQEILTVGGAVRRKGEGSL